MRRKKPQPWLLATGGVVFLAGLLTAAALLGVRAARRDLPDSAKKETRYPSGVTVLLGGGEPVYFADEVRSLRNYYFAYPSAETRREGDAEARGVRRLFGEIEVRTLEQDADAVRVEILSGVLAGKVYWVHQSQLPPPPPK
ncbi:MAG: hypothetical protein KDM91_03590 [Verrucomicrobiae bacterium]|nr:hypothetical protein [Verrucomicrobiae bacterium]MCP5540047.1 hypothetical protein [Akkermansiaceae bacterium]MCP5549980.1 hypothetical protein [Akkermansiaceae bacterium]